MPAITVTVITLNEEDRLGAALASVAWADDVVVVDAGSADRTVDIARAAGVRVAVEAWRGYGGQKNRAAELAANDWVLSLDADEQVDAALAAAIRSLPVDPVEAAFRCRRRNHFAGRPIRTWPWAVESVVRLYDRRRARFDERLVHETLECAGPVSRLPGGLDHASYRDLADYLARQQRYARLGAEQLRGTGRRPRPGDLLLRPAVTFLRHAVGRGLLLGGRNGLRLSLLAARGTRLKYRALVELSAGEGSRR